MMVVEGIKTPREGEILQGIHKAKIHHQNVQWEGLHETPFTKIRNELERDKSIIEMLSVCPL